MKEIKFRAWNKKEKMMYSNIQCSYGTISKGKYDVLPEDCWDNFGTVLEDENLEIMQYTGLKDKNGKEIYEGDILEFKFPNTAANYRDTVQWECDMTECCQGSFDGYCTTNYEYSEVIGNIHENPDLSNNYTQKGGGYESKTKCHSNL